MNVMNRKDRPGYWYINSNQAFFMHLREYREN